MWPFHKHDWRVVRAPHINLGKCTWLPQTDEDGWFLDKYDEGGSPVWRRKLMCATCPKVKWALKPYDKLHWPKA